MASDGSRNRNFTAKGHRPPILLKTDEKNKHYGYTDSTQDEFRSEAEQLLTNLKKAYKTLSHT